MGKKQPPAAAGFFPNQITQQRIFCLFSKENIITFQAVQFSEMLVGERGEDVSGGNREASVKQFFFLSTQNQTLNLFFCVIS